MKKVSELKIGETFFDANLSIPNDWKVMKYTYRGEVPFGETGIYVVSDVKNFFTCMREDTLQRILDKNLNSYDEARKHLICIYEEIIEQLKEELKELIK
jgi:hypothetical protein